MLNPKTAQSESDDYTPLTYEQLRDDMVRTINLMFDHGEKLSRLERPKSVDSLQPQCTHTDASADSSDVPSQE
ncbi:MAG: hypothetical protein QOD75_1665 [Blastocatellia bacterium]|nr:hypothetical protein [Blastocatellia bacterium]